MRLTIVAFTALLAGFSHAADNSALFSRMSESELASAMKAGVEINNKELPVRVNATTILESVSYISFDKVFMYRYTTTNVMDEKAQRAGVVRQQCASPNLLSLMKRGITLRSLYFGPNQKMTDIEVLQTDCGK